MQNDQRFFEIMARVEEWAIAMGVDNLHDAHGYAERHLDYLMSDPIGNITDDELFESACKAWMEVE